MPLSVEDIEEIVIELRSAGNDTQTVEAKRARRNSPEQLWHALSAFSNTPGQGVGYILLGIDETKNFAVAGVEDSTKVQDGVASHCADMEPIVRPRMYPVDVHGKTIVVIEVDELPPDRKPSYRRKNGLPNGAYRRVSDRNVRLNDYEVQQFMASRRRLTDDEATVPGMSVDDLDRDLVEAFCRAQRADRPDRFGRRSNEEILTRRGAMRGGELTVAGLLVFAEDPTDCIPSLRVEFIVWPTDTAGVQVDGVRFADNKTFSGPIAKLYPAILARLKHHLTIGARIDSHRTDLPEYPDVVLREALLNALAHRDLSAIGQNQPLTVHVFPSRIEITNPGGLYMLSVDELGRPQGRSTRNTRLMQLLEDQPQPGSDRKVVDNRGSGIPTIVEEIRRAGLHQPQFRDQVARFQVVFPRGSLYDAETLQWIAERCPETLSLSQRTGAALLYRGEKLTNERYRAETGVDSRVATQELTALVELQIAEPRSGGRGRHYVLHSTYRAGNSELTGGTVVRSQKFPHEGDEGIEGNPISAGPSVSPPVEARRRRLLARLRADPELTTTHLAREEGLSDATIERDLKALRDAGELPERRRGRRRIPRGV